MNPSRLKPLSIALIAALLLSCHQRPAPKTSQLEVIEEEDVSVPLVSNDTIRVGVLVDVKEANIVSDVPFVIENMTTQKTLARTAETCRVTARRIGGDKWRF